MNSSFSNSSKCEWYFFLSKLPPNPSKRYSFAVIWQRISKHNRNVHSFYFYLYKPSCPGPLVFLQFSQSKAIPWWTFIRGTDYLYMNFLNVIWCRNWIAQAANNWIDLCCNKVTFAPCVPLSRCFLLRRRYCGNNSDRWKILAWNIPKQNDLLKQRFPEKNGAMLEVEGLRNSFERE